MEKINFESLYTLQDLHYSISTLSVMADATSRAIVEMSNWKYSDKEEMKHLGGILIQMRAKFMEFSILGISKMVEDFFNNLKRTGGSKISIWDSSCNSVVFSREVRLIRHLGNVIKHDNSIVESSTGGKSAKILIDEYGFTDDTPIHWLDIFKGEGRDLILQYIYMASQFCYEVLCRDGLIPKKNKVLHKDEIVMFMLDNYVHSIPGNPMSCKSV